MHIEYDPAVDLNLLGPLAALLEERHVTRAAERAHLSQPAMSRALARLRRTFDDELFIRGRAGYELTPRAERLQRDLLLLTPHLRAVFAAETFDAGAAAETYRLAGTDYAAVILGPPLYRQVRAESPLSRLHLQSWHDGVFDDLERGAVDLVFYGVAAPPRMRSEHLYDEKLVCVLAADHPLAGHGALDLDTYLGCVHVAIEVDDGVQTVIDRHLSTLGVHRTVNLQVPYHLAALAAVPGTDLVATLPKRLIDAAPPDPRTRVLTAPPQIATMAYQMSWHPRLNDDPAHTWLRRTIREVANPHGTVITAEPFTKGFRPGRLNCPGASGDPQR